MRHKVVGACFYGVSAPLCPTHWPIQKSLIKVECSVDPELALFGVVLLYLFS